METTLGTKVLTGVIFDRDYRSEEECKAEISSLKKHCSFVRIHSRKELENFLLVPEPLQHAIERRINERNKRTGASETFNEDVAELLGHLTDPLRYKVEAKYLARRRPFEKARAPGYDESTIDERLMSEFDGQWRVAEQRRLLVPGKEALANLNSYLQEKYGVSISASLIVECFGKEDVDDEMFSLIDQLEEFRKYPVE
jgi:hypothetical protein